MKGRRPQAAARVYWSEEAIALLETGNVSHISLDHDLGDDDHGTGYDVVLWIEEAVMTRGFTPPQMSVHSANSSARQKNGARHTEHLALSGSASAMMVFTGNPAPLLLPPA